MVVKVSVIIPAYNGDRFIAEAIDSVLQQTYRDYEIIVVDDGSSDNTAQIVRQYGKAVKYLNQRNRGVAASRNLGLAAALGDYIAFLDQDDVFSPDKLATQVALMDCRNELGIVNSGWQICPVEESDRHNRVETAVKPWLQIPNLSLADAIVWKPVFLGAMLFRRVWLEKVDGFDTALEQTPDVDLFLRLAAVGCPAAWVEQVTVKYRQHENNASKNALLQAQELNQITANFFARPTISPELKILEARSRYQSLVWSAWRLHQTGYLPEMQNYLQESQVYSDRYPTELPLDWITSFENYSAEYGLEFDVKALIASREWQGLLHGLMAVDMVGGCFA